MVFVSDMCLIQTRLHSFYLCCIDVCVVMSNGSAQQHLVLLQPAGASSQDTSAGMPMVCHTPPDLSFSPQWCWHNHPGSNALVSEQLHVTHMECDQ